MVAKADVTYAASKKPRAKPLEFYLLLSAPTILHLPEVFSIPAASSLYIVLGLIFLMPTPRIVRSSTYLEIWPSLLLIAVFMMSCTSILIGGFFELSTRVSTVLVLLATLSIFFALTRRLLTNGSGDLAVVAVLFSVPLLCGFEVVKMYAFGGPEVSYHSGNSLLSLVGVSGGRLLSGNATGLLSGLALVCLGCLWFLIKQRIAILLALAPTLYLLALSDSRASATTAAICIAMFLFLRRPTLRLVALATLAAVGLAPWWLSVVFEWMNASGIDALARDGDLGTRLGAGTGRLYVWQVAFEELSLPKLAHLFGYGAGGHISSYLVGRYQWVFPSDIVPHTLHSFTLQTIIDQGYLGLVMVLTLLVTTIRCIASRDWIPNLHAKALLAALAYVFVGGLTEVAGTLYHFDVYLFLFAVVAVSCVGLRGVGLSSEP